MNSQAPFPPQVTLAVFTVNAKWEITSFSQAAEDLLGLKAADMIGRNCHDVFSNQERFTDLFNQCAAIASGRTMASFTIVLKNPVSNENLAALVTAIPVPDRLGNLSGAIVSFQETTKSTLVNPLVLDSLADGVFTVDSHWQITSFNKAAEDITGWTQQEVIGKTCSEIFHSNVCGDSCLLARSVLDGKTIINRSIFIRNKDGATVPVSISAAPLIDHEGKVIGGVETFRDITATINKELIFDSIADGVFTVDRNWKISSFNKAAESITGWKQKEVLGKSCSEVFHSNVCGASCLLAQSVKQGKTIIDQPISITAKNGETIPVNISAAPFLDHLGKVIGGVETFRDITSSIKTHLILDSIADGVFSVDRNWKITSFNRAAELITGWSSEDAIGKFCSDIFHSSICGKNCAIAQCFYNGRPVSNLSITVANAKGEKIPISISAAPLIDSEGNIIGGVETFRDLTAITSLRKQLTKNYTFDEIISKSISMQRIFNILPEIAKSASTVLILGESGTGKELVARAIYNASTRSDQPFVIVNCGALPETLLESELFGYKAGAFTDAKKDKIGRFAAAEKGTLFLDEIGDIPQSLQVKLLRVLQNKVYEPLGSNTPVTADARIITATNRNLQELVQQGLFREDLFYRLNVVKISLPPLRERREDIPLLTDNFIKKFSAQQGKDIIGISSAALNILMRYDYPGNIRELENIIEYAFILCEGGLIQPEHLPEPFYTGGSAMKAKSEPSAAVLLTLEEMEKQAIYLALERNRWRRMDTCRELGISKDTLRRKIERYGLTSPSGEVPDEELVVNKP
ncbi:MAG: sigma 54-interacting transcriptional regulator [Deltaproteobacteria bacterium]|nr:sigma 54-interacting transcriptional regulator [Deltaproteobacteria bacterium]